MSGWAGKQVNEMDGRVGESESHRREKQMRQHQHRRLRTRGAMDTHAALRCFCTCGGWLGRLGWWKRGLLSTWVHGWFER